MKKLISSMLALSMVASVSACSLQSTETMPPTSATTTIEETTIETTEETTEATTEPTENPNLIGGKLFTFGETPVITGLTLKGDIVGTEDFNKRTIGVEDIRCVFELNEHIEFNIQYEGEQAVCVYVLKHNNNNFETLEYSDEMSNYVTDWELHYDEDTMNFGTRSLDAEEVTPALYDFVFVIDGKAVAVLYVKVYKEGELKEKSDEDLNYMIHNF